MSVRTRVAAVVLLTVGSLTVVTGVPAQAAHLTRPHATSKISFPPVSGFRWVAAPSSISSLATTLKATGLCSDAVVKGAADKAGTVQDAALIAQYNPAMTKLLDKATIKKILDGAAKGAQAFAGSKAKASDHVANGAHFRVLSSSGIAVAVTYFRGGKLIEIFGPSLKQVTSFTSSFIKSAQARGAKTV